jgi:hypothetical protein
MVSRLRLPHPVATYHRPIRRIAAMPVVVAHRHTTSSKANHTLANPSTRPHPTLDSKVTRRNPVPIRNRHSKPSQAMEDPLLVVTGIKDGKGRKAGNNHSKVHATPCWHVECSDAEALQLPLGYPAQPPSQAVQQPARSGRSNNISTGLLGADDEISSEGCRDSRLDSHTFLFWL